jgi:hypothetical protein
MAAAGHRADGPNVRSLIVIGGYAERGACTGS